MNMNNKHNLIFIVYNYFSFLYKMSAKLNFKFLLPTGPLYDRCKRKVVAIFISKVFGTFNMKASPFANGNSINSLYSAIIQCSMLNPSNLHKRCLDPCSMGTSHKPYLPGKETCHILRSISIILFIAKVFRGRNKEFLCL